MRILVCSCIEHGPWSIMFFIHQYLLIHYEIVVCVGVRTILYPFSTQRCHRNDPYPIHKGGSFDVDNFRLISVLPALSKILERGIHDQLYSYLNVNKLLANCQSGFRPSYSTATCLTKISDYLFDKMDNRYLIA